MSATPIADYALLSDRHSAALVSRDGSVDWLCFPRFDSPSIFGRLLGDAAGHWAIRAAGATQVTRRYLDRTMVLETTSRTPTGVVVIVDALAMGDGNRGHELGKGAPHLLLRRATCTEGEVELHLEYVPRPEYGLLHPRVGCGRRWADRVRGRRRTGHLLSHAPDLGSVVGVGPTPAPPRRERGFRPSPRDAERRGHGQDLEPIRDRWSFGRHGVGVGVVVGAPPGVRGSVAGHGAPQRTAGPKRGDGSTRLGRQVTIDGVLVIAAVLVVGAFIWAAANSKGT